MCKMKSVPKEREKLVEVADKNTSKNSEMSPENLKMEEHLEKEKQ